MAKNSLDLGSLKIKLELDAAQALKASQQAGEEITAEQQKTIDNLENLQKQYQEAVKADLDTQVESIKSGFTKMGVAAVAGITGIVAAIKSVTDGTRQYRTEIGKLTAAGEANGYTADFTKQQYMALNAVMNDDTAAATTISNLTAIGLSNQDLQSVLNSCIGVWSAYGDSIPLDSLAESINETIQVGQVTGNLADALNWAGISEDAFNAQLAACSTEQERQRLIVDTLNTSYGGLSASYQAANGDIIAANAAQQSLNDTLAAIGASLEPINTGFNTFINTLLVGIQTWLSENQALIDTFSQAIQDLGNFIVNNGDIIISLIAGIGAAILTWNVATMIMNVVNAIKLFTQANQGASIAQAALNAVMNANPFVLVASLVAALVTTIITLWNTSEDFRNAVINVWNAIKNAVQSAWNAITGIFSSIANKFKEITNIGANLISGLWNGITSKVDWIIGKIKGFGNSVLSAIKGIFGIHSPSRETQEIGDYLVQGLAKGIEETTGVAIDAVDQLCGDVKDAFNPSLNFDDSNYGLGNQSASYYARTALGNGGGQNTAPTGGGNTVTQNNYFTTTEMSPYEQQVQIKRLQRDLVGGFA